MRLLIFIFIVSCVHTGGEITLIKSQFDGSRELNMEPHLIKTLHGYESPDQVFIGLYYNTRMKSKENIILTVQFKTSSGYELIDGITFNLDEEFIYLDELDLTDFDFELGEVFNTYTSEKRFYISSEIIDKIIKSKKTLAKLSFKKTYIIRSMDFAKEKIAIFNNTLKAIN